MAEYQEVIKQFWRICERYRADVCCANCPLKEVRGVYHCWRRISEEPEKAEELIMKWAKENPPVTNAEKFKEVFGYDPRLLAIWNNSSHIWFDDEFEEPEDGRSNEN